MMKNPAGSAFHTAPIFHPCRVAMFLLCAAVCSLPARTLTWSGSGFTTLWSDNSNWSPSFAPANGDTLIFDSNVFSKSNNNDLVGLQVHSIQFTGPSGFTISGNPLAVEVDIVGNHSSGFVLVMMDVTFSSGGGTVYTLNNGQVEVRGAITLANNLQLTAYAYTTNITFSGGIVGNGDLLKMGTGTLYLTGNPANTYTGLTLIRQGAVHLAKPSGAQAISANVFVGDIGNASSLYDDLGGQYPPAISMFIGDRGFWGVTNGATVTNLTIYSPGDIGGTGLLTLGCDVEVYHGNDTFVSYSGINCPIYLGSQTRTFHFNYGPVDGDVTFDMDGPIIGPGPGAGSPGMIFDGYSETYLNGSNPYYGPTTIRNAATVWVENSGSLGGSGSGAETWVMGGELGFDAYGITVAEPIYMLGGYIEFYGSTTLTGPIVASNSFTFFSRAEAALLDVNGVVSGPADFDVTGGIVRLSGSSPNTFGIGDFASEVKVYPQTYYNSYAATLELAKSGVTAVPVPVTIYSSSTNYAILRNLQNGGVTDVTLGHYGSWLLNGHSAMPTALQFEGDGYVDSQGGILQLTNPNTNQLRVLPGSPANYTAQILGLLSGAASTNNFFIDSNLTLNVAAQISGGLMSKLGAGTLTLSSYNSFSGQMLVKEGLLFANANNCLGTSFSPTIVSNGATLLLNGTNMTVCGEPLILEGDGINGTNGALTSNLGCTITNGITLSAPASINTPSNCLIEVQSAITGSGPLTKLGPGNLYFSGSANNAYTGDTLVNRGNLWLGKPAGVTAVPSHLVIGSGAINSPAQVWQFSSFAILGSVTVNRGGLWDLFGQAEGFTVALLEGRPPLTLNAGGDVQTGASGILYLPVGGDIAVNPSVNTSSFITGNIGLDPGPHRIGVGSGAISVGAGPECDISAVISQTSTAGDLVKSGSGTLRLSGNNTFSGTVTVEGGPLLVTGPLALGSTVGGTLVVSNGSLAIDGGLVIANEALTLNGDATAFDSRSGSNTWTGPITLSRDAGINVNSSGYLHIPSVVSGPAGLKKLGSGTLQFLGSVSNIYGGLTIVSNGVIEAGRTNTVSIPGDAIVGDNSTTNVTATLRSTRDRQFGIAAAVTLGSSGVLDLFHVNGVPQPIERLRAVTGTGAVLIGLGGRLIISNQVPFEFFGPMSGTGSVTKNGPSTMTAWGDWTLSPFGTLDIFNGDLVVHGTIDTDTNAVYSGGRLRGDGRVLAPVGVASGGGLAVDSKVPGRSGGDLEMNALSVASNPGTTSIAFDLYGPSPNGGNDKLIVDGNVRLLSSIYNLSVNFRYPPHKGDVITLLDKTTSGAIVGSFNGVLAAGLRKIGDYNVIVSYTGGDGNDLTLTVTNLALDYFSYALAEGNGNQTVEPDECNLLYVSLLNGRTNAVTITNAVLRATTSNAVVTIASASYPVIAAGGVAANFTPFQFRTTPEMVCGSAVGFELVLGVAGEGVFAVTFSPVSGVDCTHPTGPCESCFTMTGTFSPGTPVTSQPLSFAGAPAICFPAKACPGFDSNTNPPMRYLTHSFTNSTTNELCLTVQLKFDCPGAPTNALGAAAYLGNFDPAQPCLNYLGDSGLTGSTNHYPFSFRVPAGSNFVVVATARATNLVCNTYAVELFGLPCPPPVLAISPETAPQKVRVHWSTAYPGFTAQQVGNLDGTFGNMPQTPAIVGGRYAVTNIQTTTNQFFRLQKASP